MTGRFTMLDEYFTCAVCGAEVLPLRYTARDHCPRCLYSLHLDVNPGDRASGCGGSLAPIGLEQHKKGFQIVYRCAKCGEEKRNIAAADDNMELMIKLSAEPL